MPRTYYLERTSADDTDSERERLFELTREAEAAERLSIELPSSVLRRVAMLESNMRLVQAYTSSSGETQRMVEGAVIERTRRRQNILRGYVDNQGHPHDVETDEETDEEIRGELTGEGFIYFAGSPGERSYYRWIGRGEGGYLAPEAFTDVEDHRTNRTALSDREFAHIIRHHGPRPSAAAVVPQEEEREPVWYFRRAREIEREDAEREERFVIDHFPESDEQATEAEMRAMMSTVETSAYNRYENRNSNTNTPSAQWMRQSVRTDLKALLQTVQQKLEEEIEASRVGRSFREGSYLEIVDLLRDAFLCVERI